MLPYLYTVLEAAHRTGVPVFRPLLLNFQMDRNVLNLDDEFMVGADLLVAPVLRPAQITRMVYLPKGRWFDYWTGKAIVGGTTIRVDAPLETAPIFVRGGAVLPLAPEMNYVGEKPVSVLSLDLYPDNDGAAAGEWYEDDGVSPAYLRGDFRRTSLRMRKTADGQRIELHAAEGGYQPAARRLEIHLPAAVAASVSLDGAPLARGSWSREGERLTVSITDDGKAHVIVVQ
jgi:alpha-glucosidase